MNYRFLRVSQSEESLFLETGTFEYGVDFSQAEAQMLPIYSETLETPVYQSSGNLYFRSDTEGEGDIHRLSVFGPEEDPRIVLLFWFWSFASTTQTPWMDELPLTNVFSFLGGTDK